jgi:hypothetical protein
MKSRSLFFALTATALSCSKDATEDTTEDASVDFSCEEAMSEYHAWTVACGNDDGDLGDVLSACEGTYEEASSAGCESEMNAGLACFAAVDWSTEGCVEDFADCSSEWTRLLDCIPDSGSSGTVGEEDDDDPFDDHAHTNAVTITNMEITFESEADGSEQVVRWAEGEVAEGAIVLDVGTQYALSIQAFDENESPSERTHDIYEQGNFYQVLFYGSAIGDGLVAHTYGDEDENGLPIGLTGGIEALTPGAGVLTFGVFFLPSDKYDDLAERVATHGLEPYSFLFDFDPPLADFDLTVQ